MQNDEICRINRFIAELKCRCDEELSSISEYPCPDTKVSRQYMETMSGLQCALEFLKQKCTNKDQMIQAMANELMRRADSGIFAQMFQEMIRPRSRAKDFDRQTVMGFFNNAKCLADYTGASRGSPGILFTDGNSRVSIVTTP